MFLQVFLAQCTLKEIPASNWELCSIVRSLNLNRRGTFSINMRDLGSKVGIALSTTIKWKSAVEPTLTTSFLADSLDIHSCFHLSTMATFFCVQFGRRREVQMYSFRFVLFLCASHTLLMLDPLWQATELQGQNNSRFVIISVFSDKECKGNHHVIVF